MAKTWDNALYLTTDIVLLAPHQGEAHVLLIRRTTDSDAYPGHWALPGGYVDKGERVETAARRELVEETGITAPAQWHMVGYYDNPGRDPRDRVVSIAYTATLDAPVTAIAADDATDARWVSVDDVIAGRIKLAFDHDQIITEAMFAPPVGAF